MTLDLDHLEALLPRYDLAGPRYTSYPTAPVWGDSYGPDDFKAALGRIDTAHPQGISLYAHVPFCRELCHYCACNRFITREEALPAKYLDVIEREIATVAEALPATARAGQLHLGGGTPTHLTPEQLGRLVGALTGAFPIREGAELSIEVDPRVTSSEHIDVLERCGFNRISLGVQDFDPRVQEAVHRVQSAELVSALTERARGAGFEGVNFDLIYGLPYQTEESFDRTLDTVIDLAPDRIALYSYAHVTWIAKQQRGFERKDLPSGSLKLKIMLLAIRRFLEAGYVYLGMDHFAKRDDDLARAAATGNMHRNFMGYTTRECGDLIGFGPSAISEMQEGYAQSLRGLSEWEDAVQAHGVATFRGHVLSDEDVRRAWVIRKIMCDGAVSPEGYHVAFGRDFVRDFARELRELPAMQDDGLLSLASEGGFTVSDSGRVLLRNIAMVFDAYLAEQKRAQTPLFSKTV